MSKVLNNSQIDIFLREMAHRAVLEGGFLHSDGLLNGKMGQVIFLFHYAAYAGDEGCAVRASQILQQILSHLAEDTSPFYADGLCGVATGLIYLTHQKFIQSDRIDSFAAFDDALHHHVRFHTPVWLDLNYGVSGFIRYFAARTSQLQEHSSLFQDMCSDVSFLVNALSNSYASYAVMADVLISLRVAWSLGIQREIVHHFVEYIELLSETMWREDRHFGVEISMITWYVLCCNVVRIGQTMCLPDVSCHGRWMWRQAVDLPAQSLTWWEKGFLRVCTDGLFSDAGHLLEWTENDVAACRNYLFAPSDIWADGFIYKSMPLLFCQGGCSGEWLSLV